MDPEFDRHSDKQENHDKLEKMRDECKDDTLDEELMETQHMSELSYVEEEE